MWQVTGVMQTTRKGGNCNALQLEVGKRGTSHSPSYKFNYSTKDNRWAFISQCFWPNLSPISECLVKILTLLSDSAIPIS